MGGNEAAEAPSRSRYGIGLDLGGTSIKAGLVDGTGRVVASDTISTDRTGGPKAIIDQLAELSRRLMDQAGTDADAVAGIGVGIPGIIDYPRGRVAVCVNLPGWQDVPVCEMLREASGLPVVIENDANVAAYGEFAAMRRDASDTVEHLVLMTLGTGIGGGLVIAGRPHSGANGEAGELGHILIDPRGPACGCGQRGCLETYASAPALIRRTGELQATTDASNAPTTVGEVFNLAANDEAAAKKAIDEAVDALAVACLNLCRLLDPSHILLGGGVMEACPALADQVRTAVKAHFWNISPLRATIAPARLGNRAGLLGAAALAFDVTSRSAVDAGH